MKKITTLAVSLLTAACMSAGALAADQPLEKVAPFPKAEKGMKRQVIQLPQQQDESALKVELMIGQTLEVDCNHHRLGGELESKTLEGWGYDYYVFEKLSGPVSTMMACPDGKKEKKFVTAGLGDDAMLRYRLPFLSERLSERDIRHRLAAAQRLQLRLRYLIHRPGWLIFQFQHFTGPRQRFLDLRRVAVKTNTVGWDDRLQLGLPFRRIDFIFKHFLH